MGEKMKRNGINPLNPLQCQYGFPLKPSVIIINHAKVAGFFFSSSLCENFSVIFFFSMLCTALIPAETFSGDRQWKQRAEKCRCIIRISCVNEFSASRNSFKLPGMLSNRWEYWHSRCTSKFNRIILMNEIMYIFHHIFFARQSDWATVTP